MVRAFDAASVVARFAFWFGLLPFLLLAGRRARIDRLMLGFLGSLALVVVAGQVFSTIGLWENLSAWGLFLAILILSVGRRGEAKDWSKQMLKRLEEGEENGAGELLIAVGSGIRQHRLRTQSERVAATDGRASPRTADGKGGSLGWVLIGLVVAGAIFLLFRNAVQHYYLPASESYQHLAWIKYLQRSPLVFGKPTHIYQDGVYPYGYHAVFSALSLLNFLDPFEVISFAGPLTGLLLIVSVGYAAHRFTGHHFSVAVAIGALALAYLGSGTGGAARMISPLPQEFAAVFALPALVSTWLYLGTEDRDQLAMAGLAAFLVAAVNPWAFGYTALTLILLVAGAVSGKVASGRAVKRLSLAVLGVAVFAFAPLMAGRIVGIPFHRGLSPLASGVAQAVPGTEGVAGVWISAALLHGALALGVVLIALGSLLWRHGDRERAPVSVVFGIMLALLYIPASGWISSLKLDPSLPSLFLGLFAALGVALALETVLDMVPWSGQRWRTAAVALVIAVSAVVWPPVPAAALGQYEYDEEVQAYLAIIHQTKRWEWTIVSTQEQMPRVLGYGFHLQILDFVRQSSYEQIHQVGFEMASRKTGNYFVFIEKWPLGSAGPVQPDPHAAVPTVTAAGSTSTEDIYRDVQARAAIEARAWGLVEEYRKNHPDLVTTFHDGPRLRVYLITHR